MVEALFESAMPALALPTIRVRPQWNLLWTERDIVPTCQRDRLPVDRARRLRSSGRIPSEKAGGGGDVEEGQEGEEGQEEQEEVTVGPQRTTE
jgi:hypothetical protein